MNVNNAQLQSWGITVLRVVVGIIFLVHGLQKVFGFGLEGTTGFLGSLGIPVPVVAAILVMGAETLGGLALILGLFTRWAALPLAFIMLVAILTVHVSKGFFAGNGGYEFPLLLMASNVALTLLGSGAFALDEVIDRMRNSSRSLTTARQSA